MHILVVEDDKPVASLIQEMLEAENYTVVIAGNSDEACSMVEAGDNDLVILDLTLPGISGLDVLDMHDADQARVTWFSQTQRVFTGRPKQCPEMLFSELCLTRDLQILNFTKT